MVCNCPHNIFVPGAGALYCCKYSGVSEKLVKQIPFFGIHGYADF